MASSHFTLQNLTLFVFKIEPVTKFVTLLPAPKVLQRVCLYTPPEANE